MKRKSKLWVTMLYVVLLKTFPFIWPQHETVGLACFTLAEEISLVKSNVLEICRAPLILFQLSVLVDRQSVIRPRQVTLNR